MKKKLIILLFVLMILAIAIGTSPIVDYFYANGAEPSTESSSASLSSTAPDSSVPDSTAEEDAPREPHPTAIASAVVLSSGTILIALVIFIKRRDPDS